MPCCDLPIVKSKSIHSCKMFSIRYAPHQTTDSLYLSRFYSQSSLNGYEPIHPSNIILIHSIDIAYFLLRNAPVETRSIYTNFSSVPIQWEISLQYQWHTSHPLLISLFPGKDNNWYWRSRTRYNMLGMKRGNHHLLCHTRHDPNNIRYLSCKSIKARGRGG